MSTLKIKFIALCVSVVLIFAACEKDSFIADNNLTKTTKGEQVANENTIAETLKKYASSDFKAFRAAKSSRPLTEARPDMLQTISRGTIMEIEPETLKEIKRTAPQTLRLNVPTKDADFELELVKADIFTDDFKVTNPDGKELKVDLGLHYHGIIKGDKNSLVAMSFKDGEMNGFFSNDRGNYIVGKMTDKKSGKNEHIVYLESDLTQGYDTECATEASGVPYPPQLLEGDSREVELKTAGRGIRIFLEIDHDIITAKGGVDPAVWFVTVFFNQTAALYANERIKIKLPNVIVWSNGWSPYSGSSVTGLLTQFQNRYSGDEQAYGHIGGLVSFRAGGGGVAGSIGGYCDTDIDERLFISSLRSDHNTPDALTYTRSVKVFAHELGHIFGSRHTHACVWNGNNTAIDGCGTCQEQPIIPTDPNDDFDCNYCTRPPIPSGGGTMMSYCDRFSTGVNFSKGFGQQPGNVMRNAAAQMLNGLNGWSLTRQFGWGYFYGDGRVRTLAYGDILLWDGNGDICTGDGVWFYIYDGACGHGAGWYYDGIYGTDLIYVDAIGQWVTCTNGDGLVRDYDDTAEPTGNENLLKSSNDIMANAPDFDKLTPLVEKLNPNTAK